MQYQEWALRRIRQTPLAVLLYGPSVRGLEEHMERLRGKDVLYFSLNRKALVEETLLSRIGRKVDVWQINCATEIMSQAQAVLEFLRDEETLLFLTTSEALCRIADVLAVNRSSLPLHKIFLIDDTHYNVCRFLNPYYNPACYGQINSLGHMLAFLGVVEPAHPLYLFGCDGAAAGMQAVYYRQETMPQQRITRNSLRDDMIDLQREWPRLEQYLMRDRGISPPRIVNANPESLYTYFPRQPLAECVEALASAAPMRSGEIFPVQEEERRRCEEYVLSGLRTHRLHLTLGCHALEARRQWQEMREAAASRSLRNRLAASPILRIPRRMAGRLLRRMQLRI